MKIIKCPICGKPRYDDPFTDCYYCGWGYTGWEKFYKPDECEDYNSMSVNQAKAMVSAGKTVWNEPLPNKKISKKLKIILHIPHSSTYIPQSYWKNNLTMPRGEIENFNREIADLYTDELFGCNALNNVLLIDCHSFSKDIIMQKDKRVNVPDVCLGTENFTDSHLTDFIKNYFVSLGYSVAENYPYSGSMIPDAAQSVSADKFQSVMIEINRSLYLTANKQKNDNFYILQNQLNTLFWEIENNYGKRANC